MTMNRQFLKKENPITGFSFFRQNRDDNIIVIERT